MPDDTADETLAEEERHVEGLDGTGKDMSRIIGLSDGVFAFSLTFLIVTLVIPQATTVSTYQNTFAYLHAEYNSFIAYLISFFIITAWWGAHRRLFSPIVRYDGLLVRLNNIFLLIIAITPLLVGILTWYGPGNFSFEPGTLAVRFAVALFAVVQFFGGLMLLSIWRHSTRDHLLVEEKLPQVWIDRMETTEFYTIVIFGTSILIAFAVPSLAEFVWLAAVVGLRSTGRKHTPTRFRSSPTRSLADGGSHP
jgi:uncharacterized membrane protein